MRSLLTTLLAAVVFFPLTANATDVEGEVWGTWTKENSPYNVIGEIRVPPGSTLVIEPGILVDFKGHYKFIVDSLATLLAIGTETDSIYFTTDNPGTGWHGIRFRYAARNSRLSYCRLEYGKALGEGEDGNGGVIHTHYSNPTISHNMISHNDSPDGHGGAIFCFGEPGPKIIRNVITDNDCFLDGGAIHCDRSSPTIQSNTITFNWSTGARGAGIYCRGSSPMISGNTISNNSAHRSGGGIHCAEHSNAVITGNTITANSSERRGGAIYCEYSNASIGSNIISANRAENGGGIYCYRCSPRICNNEIISNYGRLEGGGIRCWESRADIRGNIISGNWTGDYACGGGVYCSVGSSPAIAGNIITGNSAGPAGGGIYSHGSTPWIGNNTIYGNMAGAGGGICCTERSNATIVSNILWADTAEYGPEIIVSWQSTATVTYCDVQGGWQGQGNIDADPLFIDVSREDFSLRWHSPCIDAGDPNSAPDPDGTRADIGALYFDQAVPGIVELYPHNTPIVIPGQGGDLSFDGWVYNFSGQSRKVDIWTYLFAPHIGRYGPLDLYNVRIPTDSLGLNEVGRYVPETAPEGEYVFVAYVGYYPSDIIDSSYFYFTKMGKVTGVTADMAEENLPVRFALFQNCPNPFNVATTINYQLPVEAHVRLDVYSVLGRKVITLVDGRQEVGVKSVRWDASAVASGLYFYKLTVGDFTEARAMMLLK